MIFLLILMLTVAPALIYMFSADALGRLIRRYPKSAVCLVLAIVLATVLAGPALFPGCRFRSWRGMAICQPAPPAR